MNSSYVSKGLKVARLGFFLLAGGCTVGPNYKRPDLPTPSAWNEARQSGIETTSGDLTRWWMEFDDPLLNSLVDRAVRSNLDLRMAQARIREARATRAVAAAGAWPTLGTSASYKRNRSSQNAFAIAPQGGSGGSGGGGSGGGDLDQNFYKAGFDASWEIDVFGGTRRSVEAADASVEASVENLRDTLVTLLGDVARNYVDLRGFQQRLSVARANLKTQQDTLELTRVRFQAGLASDLDVAQAEAEVNTTAAQIPVLESSLKSAMYSLDLLLGLEPGSLAGELNTDAAIPRLPSKVLVGLPSELLRRRPDIRGAERQFAAATAQVGAAMADLFPKFSLTGEGGLQSISASNWFTGGSRFWTIGPTISWPIFDAGKIRANIEIRNAQQEQALYQYEKTVLAAFGDVESSLVNYSQEQARYRSLVSAVAANRRALEMANELYVRGLNSFLNVLDAQRSLYATENDLAQSEATMAANLVALYKALGGGWENP
jgi:NodT family efflux transporter outer membrane factor (OMF) lipoprotein